MSIFYFLIILDHLKYANNTKQMKKATKSIFLLYNRLYYRFHSLKFYQVIYQIASPLLHFKNQYS